MKKRAAPPAFTLPELLIVIATFALAALIFFPALNRRRNGCQHLSCCNNLKQIGLAFKTWAIDNNDRFPMEMSTNNFGTMELVSAGKVFPHFVVMSNELSTPKILFCPEESDRSRRMANSFTPQVFPPSGRWDCLPLTNDSSVGYFIGLDANDARPEMILSGDRTLTLNRRQMQPGLHAVLTNAQLGWTRTTHRRTSKGCGNLLFADGSVQAVSNPAKFLAKSALGPTNRFVVP